MTNPTVTIRRQYGSEDIHYSVSVPRKDGTSLRHGVVHFGEPIEVPLDEAAEEV